MADSDYTAMTQKVLLSLLIVGGVGLLIYLRTNILTNNTSPQTQSLSTSLDKKTDIGLSPAASREKPSRLEPDRLSVRPKVNPPQIKTLRPRDDLTSDAQGFYAPDNLERLAKTTSVETGLSFAHSLPEGVVDSILSQLPQDYLRNKLNLTNLGFSSEDLTQNKPSEILSALIKASRDVKNEKAALLFFSTQVYCYDNSPLDIRASFSPTERKIYACFKNEGTLARLNKVIVYWTNISTGKIIYWGCQYLNPDTPWNYIWVEPQNNWTRGRYLVTLSNSSNKTNCLAQGRFEIK